MPAPHNSFKTALAKGDAQIGLWVVASEASVTEMIGTAGFDWLVLDGEHAPNDIRSLRDSLMALNGSDSHPVVRIPIGETWMVKQVLDAGAQTVLVPMVDTAEQARDMALAMRYPPLGVRGMGATGARASRFGEITDYVATANDEVCLLVQAESRAAIANLDDILTVEGVDGVFIGPADLSADMGFPGAASAPEVQEVITDAIKRITSSGKAAGILTQSLDDAKTYLELGATFVAVGIDMVMYAKVTRQLCKDAKALL
ncbi:2-keto-3-deoxy-L-rhamnonate aldolase [Shimia thalassica]|uniref:Hydroxypyruvate/pyruvate aldolase n=1 Tax=Shimia thalassica TaxID=1715693 RepID=A0A0P1I0N7_9RHOB|nr:HpcH/HpaI aldolase/citrate lyase family protein [Shimia thalassica]CUJ83206.1 2-keto-3-deoxy-L-rhamnonate aldolase [Shimia thalassica]